MKFFVCFALIAIVGSALASPTGSSSASVNNQESESDNQGYGDLTRLRKSAYGGGSSGGAASVPAPPCPRNYLFSCQPNLAPVPCSAPSQGYGSAGAYSSPVASYLDPNYAVPQYQQNLYGAAYLPQAYGY
ncbi:hypothetical protein AWZ03_006359 [Drosophila navojoa]|uniref:VM domain-containing protein n=1 Tax=Drosophila navojoa TaxID=7232 RepID=A0A484BER7_DRONA|nr:vitelline membrane protein Vm26Aa-like [Drosophila navojoa]TDG47228.1 hypothetical protein AWZ03_006359 [Drosophila navojoa]